ncbi:MAG TPA: hypothetical protein VNN77_05870 [candidate division Zixibacteria bacterium]|nr:hypothetical protein [candidate division Zixibacteria bacterium]
MPKDEEWYRGHVISWAVNKEGCSEHWSGIAGVIRPPGRPGRRVQLVEGPAGRFTTAELARDYILREARRWIDRQIAGSAAVYPASSGAE